MRIALLEDETEQAQHIQSILSESGHHCDSFPTGQNFLSAVLHRSYDLLILDRQIPDMTGIDVLESVRAQLNWPIPVVFLTQRDSEADIVRALDAGADDYLAKPFQTEELIARLRALIRRASGNTSSELTAGDVRLDTRSGRVTLKGEPVKLTAQEYKLLSYLMHHKGKVVSRTELIEHIYDQDFDRDSNTIEVFVTRIRKKLGAEVITTIRGLGYSLDDPADAPRA